MPDFGSDIGCYPDLDPNLTLITGPRVLLEATYRRLTTARGTYDWDPEYGFDVQALLNEDFDATTLPLWQREIQAEVEKDERVLVADVTISPTQGDGYQIAVALTTADGVFALVLGVSQVTVQILEAA
jgi:hypothetical protein